MGALARNELNVFTIDTFKKTHYFGNFLISLHELALKLRNTIFFCNFFIFIFYFLLGHMKI